MENLDALTRLGALAGCEVEFVGMKRTDDFAPATDAFGERTLSVRTAVPRGKEPSVPLPEDGDFFTFHNVTTALAKRNFFDATQVDDL